MINEFFTGRTGMPALQMLEEQIYAHRGYHVKSVYPENSLPAFKRAIERGWGAELDVHLTKDGRLVVFHDSDLKRMTGTEGILENKTWDELSVLKLDGTDERMPLFDEVLALFENTAPLIIELKAYGNHKELAQAVSQRLSRYQGLYCIESFSPVIIGDIRRLNPQIVRGQLSCNYFREDNTEISKLRKFLLTDLLLDFISKPDFIAYRFCDRDHRALQKALKKGIKEVSWTIRSKEDFSFCRKNGIIPIFENFDPEE